MSNVRRSVSLSVRRTRLSEGERKSTCAVVQESSRCRASVLSQRVEAPAAGWLIHPET